VQLQHRDWWEIHFVKPCVFKSRRNWAGSVGLYPRVGEMGGWVVSGGVCRKWVSLVHCGPGGEVCSLGTRGSEHHRYWQLTGVGGRV